MTFLLRCSPIPEDSWKFQVAKKKIENETDLRQKSKLLQNELPFKHEGYHYISVHGYFGGARKESGHGIAAYIVMEGACRYFDPNIGEGKAVTVQETR